MRTQNYLSAYSGPEQSLVLNRETSHIVSSLVTGVLVPLARVQKRC